jgi:hypothetical protein
LPYDINNQSFRELQVCATLNSAAVFSDSLPDKEVVRLEKIKEEDPERYE